MSAYSAHKAIDQNYSFTEIVKIINDKETNKIIEI